jgi:hypothetical protein
MEILLISMGVFGLAVIVLLVRQALKGRRPAPKGDASSDGVRVLFARFRRQSVRMGRI